jgi:hypothetical protein
MIFPRSLLLHAFLPLVSLHADECSTSVGLLGNESHPNNEASRAVVVYEIAELYSAALNNNALMESAVQKMQQFASREGTSFLEVRTEIELLTLSPSQRHVLEDERQDQRREEQLHLHSDLEPYLARIGSEHRKTIEDQLIRRGFVNPLSTGEVEFQFQGEHRFLVGNEDHWGMGVGKMKEVSLGPGDDFAVGQVPVTQLMYFLAALGTEGLNPTPSHFQEGQGVIVLRLGDKTYALKPNHPVEKVNYGDALAHAERVREIVGGRYGVPSELQWEFANRAGNGGKFHFGDDKSSMFHYAWFRENSGQQTHAVGELSPNAFQLFDTHGNVDEWTSPLHDYDHVVRGGSFLDIPRHLRSGSRITLGSSPHYNHVGFRLIRKTRGAILPAHTFTFGGSESETVSSALILEVRR